MEDESIKLSNESILAIAFDSFFSIALITLSASIFLNFSMDTIVFSSILLAVGLIDLYMLITAYRALKNNNLRSFSGQISTISIINIIFSAIMLLINISSTLMEVYNSNFDEIVLSLVYQISIIGVLGFSSGIFSWKASSSIKRVY